MTAAALARSRTAWTAVLTVAVAWLGRKAGLSDVEQATLLTGLQGLVLAWYTDDKAKGRR